MWKYDNERKVEIENEILENLVAFFQEDLSLDNLEAERIAKQIILTNIEVNAPMYYEEPPRMSLLIFDQNGSMNGGKVGISRKPANITYNLSSLINASSDSGLAIASALSGVDWVIPIAVAKIVYNVSEATKIEFTIVEGFIIEIIHRYHTEGESIVDCDKLFRQLNMQLEYKKGIKIVREEFNLSLNKLSKIKVISHTQNKVKLIENIIYLAR